MDRRFLHFYGFRCILSAAMFMKVRNVIAKAFYCPGRAGAVVGRPVDKGHMHAVEP